MEKINLTFNSEIIPFYVYSKSKDDYMSQWFRKYKTFYEHIDLSYSQNFLTPNDVVLDCGANMGNHTVFWSKICRCKVYSIEAEPETYLILSKNIQANNCTATPYNLIVGKGGDTRYSPVFSRRTCGETQYLENEEGEKSVRIDDLIKEKIRLIKIDTEGHEIDVLLGAKQTIESSRPILWIESHHYTERYSFEDLINITQSFGYKKPTQGHLDAYWFVPQI